MSFRCSNVCGVLFDRNNNEKQNHHLRLLLPSSTHATFVISLLVSATMLLSSDMFVAAFQPSLALTASSMRNGSGGRPARDGLNMLPISEVADHVDISSSIITAGSSMLLGLDMSDLLYKVQSLASDMTSSSGILGGGGGGITAASKFVRPVQPESASR